MWATPTSPSPSRIPRSSTNKATPPEHSGGVSYKGIAKLVFVEYMLSLRTSAHTGVAIPRLEGKCTEKYPEEWESPAIFGGNRYRVPWDWGIATTSLRTGLAMTGNLESARQAPIWQLVKHRKAARRGAGGGYPLESGARSWEYPFPYWTHRDTRLKVAEEMLDSRITWA